MAVNVSNEFHRTSTNPIDDSLVLSKENMRIMNPNLMPEKYFAMCTEDGCLYIYDKLATANEDTGKFIKLDSSQTATFTEALTRANIASGEKLSVIFGKIKKYFTDLKTVALSNSYNDLDNLPTLGTAAAKDSTNSVTENSIDLVESGAVYTAISSAIEAIGLSSYATLESPTFTGAPTAPTATRGTDTTQIATTAFVQDAIDALPKPMIMQGTVGTNGTIDWGNDFPSPSSENVGYTYKVITTHDSTPICKVGDLIVSNGSEWIVIPSGDESFTDTWRNIKVNGTEKLGNNINTGAVDFVNGNATTVSFESTGSKIKVSHNDTSSQASVTNSGRTYIQSVTLDDYGHVTSLSSGTETVTNTDRYVNSAEFTDDSTNNNVKMTLTRAGSDTTQVTANIPKVSSSSAGVAPKGSSVSTQSQSTKFLREDGTWATPSYTSTEDLVSKNNTYVDGGIGYINGDEITTINGNAATATKLGTSTVGGVAKPIYLNAGVPTEFEIQVGGRNLLQDTNASSLTKVSAATNRYISSSSVTSVTYSFVELTDSPCKANYAIQFVRPANVAWERSLTWYIGDTVKLIDGETYTISAYYRLTSGIKGWTYFQYGMNTYKANATEITNTDWKRYSWTFQYDSSVNTTANGGARIYIGSKSSSSYDAFTIQICGFKLEKGIIATDWTPAPEDITTPYIETASTRDNIANGENLSTLFGKIKKWFTDLADLAFINKPSSSQTTTFLRGDGSWVTPYDSGTKAQLEEGQVETDEVWSPKILSSYISDMVASSNHFKGSFNATNGTINETTDTLTIVANAVGDSYTCSVAGTYATVAFNVGDSLVFKRAVSAGTAPTSSDFTAIHNNTSVTDNNPTLAWSTQSKVGTVSGVDLHVTMPSNPNTWRAIKVNGTQQFSTSASGSAVDFVEGNNVSLTYNSTGNKITVAAIDTTYSQGDGITIGNNNVINCNLNSATSLGTIGTTDNLYAVGVDSNGELCTLVDGVFTSSADGLAPMASDANKLSAESSVGNYYLCADGKYRQLPSNAFNNTTYSVATQSANGLMSSTDKNKLDELEIGGRNLLQANASQWEQGAWSTSTGAHNSSTIRIRNTKNGNYIPIEMGKDYMFTRHTLPSASKTYEIVIYAYDNNGTFVSGDSRTSWQGTFPLKYKSATATRIEIGIRHSDNSTITVDEAAIARIKLEKGTVSTDWTPAPEDMVSKIDTYVSSGKGYINGMEITTISGSATKLGTSSVGATNKPIYLNNGTPTECGVFPTLNTIGEIAITDNSDLNTYITPGIYGTSGGYVGSTTAASLLNKPTFNGGFRMSVQYGGSDNKYIRQIIYCKNGETFSREGYLLDNVWTWFDWVKILTSSNISSYAPSLTGTNASGTWEINITGTVNGYSIGKSVPADAVFTDTTYESKSAASGGTDVSLVTTGEKYTWNNKSSLALGETSSTAYRGDRGKTAYDHSQSTHAPTTSKSAASGGTDLSLVTTGEKYTWGNKQNALTSQTAYTSKGSATKVPQITTNSLGQVTSITEVTITDNNDNQKVKAGNVTFGVNDVINIKQGSNVTVTGNATNKEITIAATDTTYSAGTGLNLSSNTFSVKLDYTTSGNNRKVQADGSGNLYVVQTDAKVTQTETTASSSYEVLLANSTGTSTETNGVKKSAGLTFKPSSYETVIPNYTVTATGSTPSTTLDTCNKGLSIKRTVQRPDDTYQTITYTERCCCLYLDMDSKLYSSANNNLYAIYAKSNCGYAGYFNGRVVIEGGLNVDYVYAASLYQTSDDRLKNYKNDFKFDISKLNSIPLKYFEYNDVVKKQNIKDKLHIGTSAQELRKILPELVNENNDGYLSVDYSKLSLVALDCIKQQQKQINELKKEIELLKSK